MARGPQQHRPAHIGRRMRRFPAPVRYADTGLTFQEAMKQAYDAYGQEQKRLIDQYYVPPTEPPPTEPPPSGDIALPAGYSESDRFFDDEFKAPSLDLNLWTPTIGDPKWGIWPGGIPDVNWNEPDKSPSAMGPWSYNWEYFHPDQVTTGDGCWLRMKRDDKYKDSCGYEWVSGIIRSKVLMESGLFRVIAMFPTDMGVWDGCWNTNDAGHAFEPDAVETGFVPYATGADRDNSVCTTLHQEGGVGGGQEQENQVRYNGGSMSSKFRTWDWEYIAGSHVRFWLDGVERHYVPTSTVCKLSLIVNHSMASPVAVDWHNQVDDTTQAEPVLHIKRCSMYRKR